MVFEILTVVNTAIFVIIGLIYLRETYTIVPIETWNTLADFYNKNYCDEPCSGEGFFKEYIDEDDYDEEEEEEENSKNKKKKTGKKRK